MTSPARSTHPKAALRLSALLPALLLSACFQAPAPAPVPATPPPPTSGTLPPPISSDLKALGTVTVNFSGLTDPAGLKVAVPGSGALGPAALTDRSSVQLKVLSHGTFTTGTRGVDGVRYLYATFLVRNADGSGAAYPTARQNLTLVAASTAGTVPNTPYSALLKYDGSPADASAATTITPTAGLMFDRGTERPTMLPGGEDLQVFAEDEVQPLTAGSVTRAFPFGYVVRHRVNTASRVLPATPAADDYAGVVTIGLKLPLQASVADDPYSFNMTFAVADDSVTRVTESPEEQALGNVQARATALGGAQVALLCGSSYTGSNALFIGSATTAGAPGNGRLTHLGGDVALKALPSSYFTPGNVNYPVPTETGLGQYYAAYPTTPSGPATTLTFAGQGTARGGQLNMSGDGAFTFTSKVGDGAPAVTDQLKYTVSDGHGCTSPVQTAPVNVNGRVWFARDTAAAGGDGRQDTPFNTVANLQNASAAGDFLYLYRGSGAMNGALTLKNNQSLIGEGSDLRVGPTRFLPAGAQPSALNNPAGVGLTLASANTVKGVNVTGTSGGIVGASVGQLTLMADAVRATAGPALDLRDGLVLADFKRVDATASSQPGVLLSNLTGFVTVLGTGSPGSGGTVQASGSTGYQLAPGNANLDVKLTNVLVQNSTTGLGFATPVGSTGRLTLNVQNSSFLNNGTGLLLNPGGSGTNDYTINGSTFSQSGTGGGLFYSALDRGSGATDRGRITNNTVSVGTTGTANGITLSQAGPGKGVFSVTNNRVTSFGAYGLSLSAGETGNGRLDVTLQGNTVSSPAGNGVYGIYVLSGINSADTSTLCLNATSNNARAADGSGLAGFALRKRPSSTMLLQGLTNTSDAGAISFIQSSNVPSTAQILNAPLNPQNGTCTLP
ncbi:VcbS [Deinococcus enclensis]|uniref:Right handed beta helix region n=1 Tax=Deinococcus enclensis TaxID=1049582 RepID=A0ABT9MC04_9DEIO|nr:VcbS [Deinococcus enclensis]MDP9764097.1 hypothetical protein [Deinococcus enclensis]